MYIIKQYLLIFLKTDVRIYIQIQPNEYTLSHQISKRNFFFIFKQYELKHKYIPRKPCNSTHMSLDSII